jgi:hypothetical protein
VSPPPVPFQSSPKWCAMRVHERRRRT